jgi:rhamnosyltransferase
MPESVPDRLPGRADVCAVVVTYHPDPAFRERIGRVTPQVGTLIIVDNGSNAAERAMLHELSRDPAILTVSNGENLGIARALNIGIAAAREKRFDWVLLLDQDTCVDDDLLETLLAVHAEFPDRAHLAVIGAGFRELSSSSAVSDTSAQAQSWEEVESVITSGSLIPLATHAIIGPFREEFFIDYVDTDYCFRARGLGFRVIKTRRSVMAHAIGAATTHSLLWLTKSTSNHSADRRYYISRNDTVMLREHGHYAWGMWAVKSLSRCLRRCKRVALYERAKTRKIIAIAQGWFDGVRGRMGPR